MPPLDPALWREQTREKMRGLLAEHGATAEGVWFPGEEKHRLRFEQLVKLLPAAEPREPVSVNDWGCGYGALFEFLTGEGVPIESYTGYDVTPEMLAAARKRVRDPRAEFVEAAEPTREADYSFVSGTFNARFDATEEAWQAHLDDVLLKLAECSRLGFAINMLSSYVDWEGDGMFHADPMHFFDFAKRRISRRVTLLHDYPLWEWTLLVRLDQ
jgi:SAM-dependent methyltransferase